MTRLPSSKFCFDVIALTLELRKKNDPHLLLFFFLLHLLMALRGERWMSPSMGRHFHFDHYKLHHIPITETFWGWMATPQVYLKHLHHISRALHKP